jgi:hypothetical protein
LGFFFPLLTPYATTSIVSPPDVDFGRHGMMVLSSSRQLSLPPISGIRSPSLAHRSKAARISSGVSICLMCFCLLLRGRSLNSDAHLQPELWTRTEAFPAFV